jgi:monoamine oxidase
MGRSVIIVGGGVSGLAAAAELAQAGCGVTLLEGKDRFGGRILTRRSAGHIVELGAEFVHGKNESMANVLREVDLELEPVSEKNQIFANGRLREVDLWGRASDVISKIDPRHPDETFSEFLSKQSLDAETKQIALGFVEGFNASDAKKIGAHSLLRAEFSAGDATDQQTRIRNGYQSLVDHLIEKARSAGAGLHLNARVQSVRWKRGEVLVDSHAADSALITLPLGVLKAGQVRFTPDLVHKKDAIEGLHFGNVIKLVFVFNRAWWPESNFGFIHDFNAPIPTWWSDSRGPVLVGWVAGRKADALLNAPRDELRQMGLEILKRLFGRIEEPLDFQWQDWSRDETIRGACSYIPVNGLDLPKVLAAPVEETLFFAGEATATDAQMGTVTGALESGLRAAREVLRLPT